MRALVYAPHFPPAVDGGGPIKSLAAVVRATPVNWESLVLTSDRDLGAAQPLPVISGRWSTWHGHATFYADVTTIGGLLKMWHAGTRTHSDVIYVNSFFNWRFSLVPQMLALVRRRGPRVLVAVRGEMGAAALRRRGAKKRLLIGVYKLLRAHMRVTFHASTENEAADIRATFGDRVEIVVRVNDTLLPRIARATAPPPRVRLLFVGRVVPHKGLLIALQALSRVEERLEVTILGPAEDSSYADECHSVARSLHHDVVFRGSVDEETVLQEMALSTLLVLPTAGENFGHVVAEALSTACPVMVADTTPWSETVRRHSAGAVVPDRTPEAWSAALTQFLSVDAAAAREGAAAAFDEWRSRETEHLYDLAYPQHD